jgi:UDP-glucuronate 4-epimerase
MAYAYAELYHIPATGICLFTAYGPWVAPTWIPPCSCRAILKGKPIRLFNHGNMNETSPILMIL